jgi:hypothetical protein
MTGPDRVRSPPQLFPTQGANLLARGDRKPARWNKDRQRKKKARDARQIAEKKAAAAAKR